MAKKAASLVKAVSSTAVEDRHAPATIADLKRAFVTKRVPQSELYRYDPGRELNLDRIQSAIRSAEQGFMADLTDLAGKTVDLDPHLANSLLKRFGQIDACKYELAPAQGQDVDPDLAAEIADDVRYQLECTSFKQAISDLAWGLFDGRSALEVMWKQTVKGRVELGSFEWIHPRRLSFGPSRELRFTDRIPMTGFWEVGIALQDFPGKFVTFTPRLFREYPEREGLAPRCLYWAFFKRFSARERMVLAELFGKPWKIVEVDEESKIDSAELDAVIDSVDALGAQATTARLAPGVKLTIPWVNPDGGTVHTEIIRNCDEQISKLVLGQTMTSDDGSSLSQANVHLGQQNMILARDARMISEVIQHQLIRHMVEVNYGDRGRYHIPTFKICTDPEIDRAAEQARLASVLQMGVPISLDQVYEISGFRKPAEDEVYVTLSGIVDPTAKIIEPVAPEAKIEIPSAELTGKILAKVDSDAVYYQSLIDDGVAKGSAEVHRWGMLLARAVAGKASQGELRQAIDAIKFPTARMELQLNRRIVHAMLTGALEAATGKPVPGFARMPFKEAVKSFKERQVLSPDAFAELTGAAKRKAFTVTGMASEAMIRTVKDQLAKSIEAGGDLREFRKQLLGPDGRLETAGWSKANPSRVELVFRNAVQSSYGDGTIAQMSQPAVKAARPYWQIIATNDDRTRPEHRAVNGKVLSADDPFWKNARPPFGHQCRCRIVSLSEADLKRRGLTVSEGSSIRGLPDDGWDTGLSLLEI